MYETERLLCEITGMDAFTLQPLAGAHGELTGVMLIAAYHQHKGNKKTKIIVPDSAMAPILPQQPLLAIR